MADYDVEVEVQVRERGEISDKLTWRTETQLEAPDLMSAAAEGLRQAPGDLAVDLPNTERGGAGG